ncbi:protein-disulfide reductase DsbD [Aquamicrobium soli]|uniref:Protein-disulfide reductase DsbD n=1 Tax=Aquamicrobium soli TaxID=1811518 RepID=A0ABV7KB94_9HYPH
MPPPADKVFGLTVERSGADGLTLHFAIAPGNYIYRDSLQAKLDGRKLPLALPAGDSKDDPNFGVVEVYHSSVEGRLTGLPASGQIEVVSRGCAEEGICYPPLTRSVDIATLAVHDVELGLGGGGGANSQPSVTETQAPPPPQAAAAASGADSNLASLLGGGLAPMLAAFLGFGLLLSLTPCVFPMIPILSAMLGGAGGRLSAGRGFALSLTYALAMAAAYGLVGLVAGLTGANLQAALQTPWALGLTAALFVALALSMFGVYDLALPAGIAGRFSGRGGNGSLTGAALLGFGSALIVGPCVTPPLAAAMLYAVQTGEAAKGAAALFALGLGMGLPLVAVGTFGAGILPKAGPWLDRIRPVFGAVFLAIAVMLAGRLLPGPAVLGLWGVFAIGVAVFVGAFDRLDAASGPVRRLGKAAGVAAVVYGAVLIVGASIGNGDPFNPLHTLPGMSTTAVADRPDVRVSSLAALDKALAASQGSGRPVLVSFTADWCTVCKSNEAVMAEPAVRGRLKALPTIVADVTAYNEATRALMARFAVVGPPTLLLIDGRGREIPGSRLTGPVTVESIETRLAQAGV